MNRFIARYMIISDREHHTEPREIRVVPNGLPGLEFNLGENFFYHNGEEGSSREISCSNVIGIHNCTYTSRWEKSLLALAVIFKPLGLFYLLGQNMAELKNDLTPTRLTGLKDQEQICEQLRHLPLAEQKIALIERWLEQKLATRDLQYTLSEFVADQIILRKGNVSVTALAKDLNINKKYIERSFSHQLGLSPKEFAEIIRFNYLNSLMQHLSLSWQDLVYRGNFHDQSHLIKHFQRMSGLSPGAYRERTNKDPACRFLDRHNVFELTGYVL